MRKLFVETNADSMVVFTDDNGKCYVFHDTAFGEPLTLEVAKTADYGNCEGCTTAEEIMYSVGTGEIYDTEEVLKDADSVTEFPMSLKEMRAILNLSQQAFGEKYNIPKRSIENWESGVRKCPDYVLSLLDRVVREDSAKRKKPQED